MRAEEIERLELMLLLEAVFERYGYDFRNYAADSIERRVRSAMSRIGAPNLGELMHRVVSDQAVFAILLSQLTVQVTEMFRDPSFYRAFRREVVPVLRTHPEIKIWHAGCASGEEVYASAILLMEEDLYERSQIYGTDIDPVALERAQAGVFTTAQLESFDENYRRAGGSRPFTDYFTYGYSHFAITQKLRSNLVFFQHDLGTDFSLGEMTVIFCRNVIIYFNGAMRVRVFSILKEGLRAGGFLCLGKSEWIPPAFLEQFREFAPTERIFRSVVS